MERIEQKELSAILLAAPGWARVGLTMPDPRMRERAADTLAAGRKRYIVPGAIAMLHQVSWELGREMASNVFHSARALEKLNSLMADLLSAATGKTREQIDLDLSHDHYLYDREIIEYGLADEFWDPKQHLPLPRSRRVRGRFRAENNEIRQRAPREE